ncbi:MAG: amidohydrolase [SAR202 cluster bacterium]|mgnify:FL=1|nr:amidohydrolase [SAR202 cluster bacterium]MQF93241.1 amidohydrolase [SAR202 cluster bacterium]|tara:strand:- start:1130 stop:2455 length:1326 start_codon:yes stop_codon:yes gene_type:complete
MSSVEELKLKSSEIIERNKKLAIDLSKNILSEPETGYKEFKTNKKIYDALNSLGLQVQNNLAITGLMTTIYGDQPGPHVAVIGELDGLPVPGHPFEDKNTHAAHACGHHIQIGNMLSTLLALNSPEILKNLSGSISFIAVPSEEYVEIEWRKEQRDKGSFEFLGGKQELVKLGIFDEIDISMMTHARGNFSGFGYGGTGNGLVAKFIEFHGKSSHAGGDPHLGINALNAANIALSSIHANRETFFDDNHIRVHPIITHGGSVVNQVPEIVTLETFVRGASIEAIKNANLKVDNCLRAGAMAVGAEVEINTLPGYFPLFHDSNLQEIYKQNLSNKYESQELSHGGGSTDMGDLAHLMPVIHPYVGGATDASAHTAGFIVEDYELAVVEAGKMMAYTIIDLLFDGASKAKEVISKHNPKLTKSEYLKVMREFSNVEVANYNIG